MNNPKNYRCLFLLYSLAFLLLSCSTTTKAELKKAQPDRQKSANKQKSVPAFSIKSSVIDMGSDRKVPGDQKNEATAREDLPQISFDSPHFDFGEVFEGTDVFHSFTVKNTGTGMLRIKTVKPG